MTPEQALKHLEMAAKVFKGTLEDHQILQESIRVLKAALEKLKQE